ncbi:unnamed protein product (macronuclear) [Paramecium tetraurelia]|uniref:IBB domain-containing protein n=1 Tax=Paramecium tetraurelia TaxID=5888 RepID=A0E389_PARTE|nr:uncharacterized protein GSPATT00022929001 [Paramecium tetraurelia]CAK89756.1 unnamed protein product [Paramecium tetraurelia]|eukprot:XP_001457153.1 hypothetical protein (macronuclear) [Paramecium tetraurelia strain d4-2]
MLQLKKEQFRQQIRRQRLDAHLMQARRHMLSITQTHQNELHINSNGSPPKPDQIFITKDIASIMSTIFNSELTNSSLEQLQQIVDSSEQEELENTFVQYFLGQRLLQAYEKEQDLNQITELQYIIGSIAKKSQICKCRLLELNTFQSALKVLNFEIEYDDYCMLSLVYLITIFVESDAHSYSDQNKLLLLTILEKLCKKLVLINYMDMDIESEEETSNEVQHSLLSQIFYFLSCFIQNSQFAFNITHYQNIWKIVQQTAFVLQDASSLRLNALQVLAEISKQSDKQKLSILQKSPQILFQLVEVLEFHIAYNSINNCIRLQASLTLKNLVSIKNCQIMNDIHSNKIPINFLEIVKLEEHQKVLYHQIEAFYYICDQSTLEDCLEIYENGLMSLIVSNFQEIKDTNNFALCKSLLKLTYAIMKHSEFEQKLSDYFRQYNLLQFLNDIGVQSQNQNIIKRATKILNYFNN